MKRLLGLLLAMALCLAGCAGAQKKEEAAGNAAAADGAHAFKVVATIFPPYDFARALTAGTEAEVSMLIKPGVESHTFDPSPNDILSIEGADVFLCIGGHDEAWVDRVLDGLNGWEGRVVRLIDCVQTLEEDHDHEHEEGEAHEEGVDEHIWTSPRNAALMAKAIGAALREADPAHAEAYRKNEEAYLAQLDALDQAFAEVVAQGERREIVFGDRFPFRYFAEAYGLTWWAAFSGCSGESEPSAAQVAELIDEVRAKGIPVVYHIEQGSVKTARIIAEETGAQIQMLHSCHNLTKSEIEGGETYLSLMGKNVEALKLGLGTKE